MIAISDEKTCQLLWERLNLKTLSFGVSGNFEFRKFYSSLFGMRPYFICDNLNNPSYLIPLCKGKNGLDWLGTKELEDTSFFCKLNATDLFFAALRDLQMPLEIHKVNELQLKKMHEYLFVLSSEVCGTKVIVTGNHSLIGRANWSERNLRRVYVALATLVPEWSFQQNPIMSEINSVFEESVKMFSVRDRTPKFEDINRKKKYSSIFTSSIPGVRSVLAKCLVGGESAMSALILLSEKTATVSIVTINIQHPESKIISRYGFRYAITSLPLELQNMYGCHTVDYQGGNHSWKREVSANCQLLQYDVQLN